MGDVVEEVHICRYSPSLDEVDTVTLCGRERHRTEHQDHHIADEGFRCSCGAPICERCRVEARRLREQGWTWRK